MNSSRTLPTRSRSPRPCPVRHPATRSLAGKYLVGLADCAGRHTSWYGPRNPGLFAGGNHITRGTLAAFSTNITRHASGTGYPTETFIMVMLTGKGGSLSPVMPWAAFRGLHDDDLAAIHAALGSVPAVAHYIGNVGEPQHCAVCGQQHPLGSYNRLETPVGVRLTEQQLERLAARYHSNDFGVTLAIRRDGSRLYGREDNGPEIELVPLSATRFLAPGWVAPVEFVVDGNGRVTHAASLGIERVLFERLP